MRSLIRFFTVFLIVGSLVTIYAQTSGLQTGFTIVTVISGNSAGILPSERLTLNEFGITTQTELSPAALLTNSALVVSLGTTGIRHHDSNRAVTGRSTDEFRPCRKPRNNG
jgi:hypothetical protein